MWSSERRAFLAVAAVGLVAACGFRPVYGPGGSAEGLRGQIAIDPPRDEFGFALTQQLERRLGVSENPLYRLGARISVSETRLGVTARQETTRISVRGRVSYTLARIDSGDAVSSGTLESFASYSTTGTPFATQTAQEDTRERLMVILADQIVARLLATAGTWAR